ncbi:MAG: energy-coupling factor transporter transmembrane component T [Anaerolineae bacterium]
MNALAFRPGESIFHRLYPPLKLGALVAATVVVMWVDAWWFATGILILALAMVWSVGVSPMRVPGRRGLWTVGLVLFLIQVVFVQEGRILLTLWPGRLAVTLGGLIAGARAAGRFLSIVLLSNLFVLTTDPSALAYSLMQLGLPYRYGFTLVTALRLAPIFRSEGNQVYEAQLVRGVRYDQGGLRRWWEMGRRLVMPLLVSALGMVDALSVSMEGRCFGMYRRRTFLRPVRFTGLDALALIVLLVSLGAIVAWQVG